MVVALPRQTENLQPLAGEGEGQRAGWVSSVCNRTLQVAAASSEGHGHWMKVPSKEQHSGLHSKMSRGKASP